MKEDSTTKEQAIIQIALKMADLYDKQLKRIATIKSKQPTVDQNPY
jgi:hypothetical protein